MWQLKEVKISSFKNINHRMAGFDTISNFNILVGQNNIGKSTLLQTFDILVNKEERQVGLTSQTRIQFTFVPTEDDIRRVFSSNTSGGYIGGNYYEFGSQFIGKKVTFNYSPIKIVGEEQISLAKIESASTVLMQKCQNVEQFVGLGANYLSKLQHQKIIKLSADRNLVPELQSSNKIVKEDGQGATNLLRQYLNVGSLPNEIVEIEMLDALNLIMRPENQFERIMCQEIESTENDVTIWEIMLLNENGKIPISSSGSGLRTVLLVLIKLLLEVREIGVRVNGNESKVDEFVFVFEELENNLHPTIQRNLFEFLYQWSINNNTHIFLTTHSNVPLNMFSGRHNVTITHIKKETEGVVTNSALSFIENEDILMNLGVRASDLLQSNAIIWVEGPSDRIYLNKWIELYSKGEIKENLHYQILFYGGRLLSHLTGKIGEENEMIQLFRANRHSIIVIDSDKTDSKKRINRSKARIKKEFEENNSLVWVTQGKEIENYLSQRLIKEVYRVDKQIGQYEKIDDFLDVASSNKKLGTFYVRNKVTESIKLVKYMDETDFKILDLEERIKQIVDYVRVWNGMD
ncbi:TPA: ATP-binding protein [Streptococcus suis]|nr:ATP-binding protein [Streptococcus suis]HEM4052640.1 ATP-binding protein [Streptococcus suis]